MPGRLQAATSACGHTPEALQGLMDLLQPEQSWCRWGCMRCSMKCGTQVGRSQAYGPSCCVQRGRAAHVLPSERQMQWKGDRGVQQQRD